MATAYIPYRAKKCKFYLNGDTKFYGKQYVVNPKRTRNFDAFLQELTNNLKTNRPIRNICTPVNGHRVTDLEDLVNDGRYVAVPGEKFKKCGYLELGSGMDHLKGTQSPRNMEVKPVEHSKLWRSSGRIRKIPTVVTTIFVYRNGLEMAPPCRVVVTHQMCRIGWDAVFPEIQNRLRPTMGGAPKKLCTIDGQTVTDVAELKNLESYVLVCRNDYGGFRKINYGRPLQPFHTSPRPTRKPYHGTKLEPLKGRKADSDTDSYPNSTGSSEKSSKTVKSTPTRKPIENRPKPRRQPKKEEDTVFHAKPVKHKRTPDSVRQVDLDKDEGGIFKSKQKNTATQDASQVEETNDTLVDLPVDQVKAEEVDEEIEEEEEDLTKTYRADKEEREPTPKQRSPTPKERTPSPKVDPRRETAATQIQAGVRGHQARKKVKKMKEEKKIKDEEAQRALDESVRQYQEAKEQKEKEETRERDDAATTIQAGYRGYRDRQRVKSLKEDTKKEEPAEEPVRESPPPEEIAEEVPTEEVAEEAPVEEKDNKEEQDKAATKIQAGYRGYKDREKVKNMRNEQAKPSEDSSPVDEPPVKSSPTPQPPEEQGRQSRQATPKEQDEKTDSNSDKDNDQEESDNKKDANDPEDSNEKDGANEKGDNDKEEEQKKDEDKKDENQKNDDDKNESQPDESSASKDPATA